MVWRLKLLRSFVRNWPNLDMLACGLYTVTYYLFSVYYKLTVCDYSWNFHGNTVIINCILLDITNLCISHRTVVLFKRHTLSKMQPLKVIVKASNHFISPSITLKTKMTFRQLSIEFLKIAKTQNLIHCFTYSLPNHSHKARGQKSIVHQILISWATILCHNSKLTSGLCLLEFQQVCEPLCLVFPFFFFMQ